MHPPTSPPQTLRPDAFPMHPPARPPHPPAPLIFAAQLLALAAHPKPALTLPSQGPIFPPQPAMPPTFSRQPPRRLSQIVPPMEKSWVHGLQKGESLEQGRFGKIFIGQATSVTIGVVGARLVGVGVGVARVGVGEGALAGSKGRDGSPCAGLDDSWGGLLLLKIEPSMILTIALSLPSLY
jgi:hypothetical protein